MLMLVVGNLGERVIVKRKLDKGPKLEELEGRGQDKREGRHLLFMQDIFLQLQCLTNSCNSEPNRAEFCCLPNVNLACCAYRNPYNTVVDDWRPIFGVLPGYRPPTSLPSYNEHHEHTEHHEYYEHSHQGGGHQHHHHHENDRP